MNDIFVSADWLYYNLENEKLILLDVSLNKVVTSSKSEISNKQIPKARSFDLKEKFSDRESELPNTFPSTIQFENESRNLGISKSSTIVVYDDLGVYSSPRVWWMYKTMGHKNVYILDGGLPAWIECGYDVILKTKENNTNLHGSFIAKIDKKKIKNFKFIRENIENKNALVVDARSAGRFTGIEKDPRKNIQSGSIPNSINIPYQKVLRNGKYKSKEEIKEIFNQIGHHDLVFTCGSGITACILLVACELVFENNTSIYDGSWTEWANGNNLFTV